MGEYPEIRNKQVALRLLLLPSLETGGRVDGLLQSAHARWRRRRAIGHVDEECVGILQGI